VSEEDAHLASLLAALNQIERLSQQGKTRYDASLEIRLALQRLWIGAGEAARRHCRAAGIDDGIEPWSEIRRLRDYLAHHVVEEIDDTRLFIETVTWTGAYLDRLKTAT
jgi:uncharacterized protein with HEPN domain